MSGPDWSTGTPFLLSTSVSSLTAHKELRRAYTYVEGGGERNHEKPMYALLNLIETHQKVRNIIC